MCEMNQFDDAWLKESQKRATVHAVGLCQLQAFKGDDPEDLAQDLTIALLEAWASYDPKRAQPQTYMEQVLTSRSGDMLKQRRRENQARRTFTQTYQPPASPTLAQSDLKMDVWKAIDALDEREQGWATILCMEDPGELAKECAVSRQTFYGYLEKVRQGLLANGMADYVGTDKLKPKKPPWSDKTRVEDGDLELLSLLRASISVLPVCSSP